MPVFRGFPAENIVAVFDEAAGGGDIENINSPRNAPALNPINYLPQVYWHSNFFQYELAFPIQTVNVSFPSVPATSEGFGFNALGGTVLTRFGTMQVDNVVALAHGLGYRPRVLVAYLNNLLPTGRVVPSASGTGRFLSTFSDATNVYIRCVGASSTVALNAESLTFQILVLRNQSTSPTLPLFGQVGSSIVLGKGKINTSLPYLRNISSGETPFSIDLGKTGDVNNGAFRFASGGTLITEPGYGGSFSAPPYINVGT